MMTLARWQELRQPPQACTRHGIVTRLGMESRLQPVMKRKCCYRPAEAGTPCQPWYRLGFNQARDAAEAWAFTARNRYRISQ
jgi:hypothetical protein